jgi:hypothetical protein
MTAAPFRFTSLMIVLFSALFSTLASFSARARAEDACVEHARRLLDGVAAEKRPALKVDASLTNPEAFSIRTEGEKTQIVGGGPAGVLYGVEQWLSNPAATSGVEKPDFELRGTALFLMKEGSYDYQLTPQEFPWFYDRPLLTKYFDCLQANRFNTIFLWSGHMFPSIVTMPEYPDATDLKPEDLERNQKQFRWFTDECAKRNIRVLMHFYQIHIPKSLAKARKIPMHYNKPNDFVKKYVRYALTRFLSEFSSVGLYVCPGEALDQRYTGPWIHDVILAAAKDSKQNPTIVVRAWGLDPEGFKKLCVPEYENLYTELKHNVEMIVSPVPDRRHAQYKNMAKKHIVNVHEVADIKPFRWGSPSFIHEMVGHWKEVGLDGAECYGMISWRWPYSLDKLEPAQTTFWPKGKKLLSFERDWIWFEALGRYLWKVDRPEQDETAYWTGRFAKRFGGEEAGRNLLKWYDTTGPVLPGLQNLTHVHNMNFYPTAVGKEQMVDAILDTAACTRDYPAQPVDAYFFDRYKQKYNVPDLTNRITMPVAEYADKLAAGQTVAGAMTPDKVVDLLVEMAEEGCRLAESVQKAATVNQEEAARFVTDSQALALVTQAWQQKVYAAIAKRCYQKTKDAKYAKALLDHTQRSVAIYEKLVALTDKTYVNATDMVMWLSWHEGLKAFKKDLDAQKKFLTYRTMRYKPGTPEQIAAWQSELRTRLFKLMKLDDLVPKLNEIPFDAKEVRTWEMPGFTVKEMTIQSTPSRRMEIVLTLPKESKGPLPAVVCIGGHGSRKFSPYTRGQAFGPLPADDSDGGSIYKGFGSELAKNGYVTISTLVSQHNVYEPDRTLMGERLWDLLRCVSYVESLPNVDKKRIGCAGLSLGGEMAMWLAAMDPRIAAVDSSGWLTTMDQLESNHCLCWKFDGLRELVDWADVFGMIAPRPLECQNGRKETPLGFYPPLAAKVLAEIRPVYQAFGQPKNVSLDVHNGAHEVDLPAMLKFLDEHLKHVAKPTGESKVIE